MKIIPELRFPVFEDAGAWVEKKLGEICYNISSGKDKNFEGGIFELYGSTGIIGKSEIPSYIGDYILVARVGANAGLLNRAKGEFGVTDNTLVINLKKYELTDFLYYNLEKIGLNQLVFGSGQPLITGSQLKCLLLPIPKSEKEQQKIASCLSSLDELIAAHSQKLDLLKDHKKGLMQNLFPNPSSGSGGESVPKYRFPEFENDGDWVEKKLGEVAHFLKGKGISKSDIVENGKLPCVRYGELYTYYNETVDIIKSYTNKNVTELVLSEAGDVIIPASGETQIDIATASSVLRSGVALGGDLNIIRSKLNGVFLAYYLNSAKKEDIAKLAQGISVVHLYSSQLQTLHISFPRNPKEQQKIASCLSAADELITAQAERIAQLQQHKKGLMQGLFPKMEG
jgi:type I restriction enzyme S subunit